MGTNQNNVAVVDTATLTVIETLTGFEGPSDVAIQYSGYRRQRVV